jgi:hypothetical protein
MTLPLRITEEAQYASSADIPDRIWDEARQLRNVVLWTSNSSVEAIAMFISAAEQRGMEMERPTIDAVHDILRADDRYGALAYLPAGGVECEEMVEKAVDLLAAAIRSRTTEPAS